MVIQIFRTCIMTRVHLTEYAYHDVCIILSFPQHGVFIGATPLASRAMSRASER